ncbi:MAG: hypothetical protein Q8O25_14445 [Sulfurisoma sp.]|nr:hypothetical protein [Sulfurisoma sp.]
MLTVMDMNTGKTIEDEFGSFEHEVMNAECLPPLPGLQLGLQTVEHYVDRAVGEAEVEAFLRRLYRNV